MKQFLLVFCSLAILFGSYGFYQAEPVEKESAVPVPHCPTTLVSDNDKCLTCHVMLRGQDGKPYFGLKPVALHINYPDKPTYCDIIPVEYGKLALYMTITQTDSHWLLAVRDFIYRHPEFNHLIIELKSPGGSVMDAWRSVGIIRELQSKGVLIETRCYGMAASAAFFIMAAGDFGHRFVNPHAQLMVHKLWTFKMFDFETPDSAADEAAIMEHFQNNINNFIIERSQGKLSLEKLQECIFKKDFWMTGKEFLEFGLADGFI